MVSIRLIRARSADAQRHERLSFTDVLTRDLQVMDATAIALCRENDLPILVFNLHEEGAFARVLSGAGRYTIIETGVEGV